MKTAIVLLSGGLDSATVLAIAKSEGFACHALSVNYGQKHDAELAAATRLASAYGVLSHKMLSLPLSEFGGSALTDQALSVPENVASEGIPITYVPARNTILLSLSLAFAEVTGAQAIFVGINAVDYSGYPDCRPEFLQAFEALANVATKAAVEGQKLAIYAPLMHLSKGEIIRLGTALGVKYENTVTCYQADHEGRACGRCESCALRRAGFEAANLPDPTRYF